VEAQGDGSYGIAVELLRRHIFRREKSAKLG